MRRNNGLQKDDSYGSTFREEMKRSMDEPAGPKHPERRRHHLRRVWYHLLDDRYDFWSFIVAVIAILCIALVVSHHLWLYWRP